LAKPNPEIFLVQNRVPARDLDEFESEFESACPTNLGRLMDIQALVRGNGRIIESFIAAVGRSEMLAVKLDVKSLIPNPD
jgi:hypothetical protein